LKNEVETEVSYLRHTQYVLCQNDLVCEFGGDDLLIPLLGL